MIYIYMVLHGVLYAQLHLHTQHWFGFRLLCLKLKLMFFCQKQGIKLNYETSCLLFRIKTRIVKNIFEHKISFFSRQVDFFEKLISKLNFIIKYYFNLFLNSIPMLCKCKQMYTQHIYDLHDCVIVNDLHLYTIFLNVR